MSDTDSDTDDIKQGLIGPACAFCRSANLIREREIRQSNLLECI